MSAYPSKCDSAELEGSAVYGKNSGNLGCYLASMNVVYSYVKIHARCYISIALFIEFSIKKFQCLSSSTLKSFTFSVMTFSPRHSCWISSSFFTFTSFHFSLCFFRLHSRTDHF